MLVGVRGHFANIAAGAKSFSHLQHDASRHWRCGKLELELALPVISPFEKLDWKRRILGMLCFVPGYWFRDGSENGVMSSCFTVSRPLPPQDFARCRFGFLLGI